MPYLKHGKIVSQHYEINLGGTHRTLGKYIDEFLEGSPDELGDEDAWNESHSVLRDFEGDFDGIEIYYDQRIFPIIDFIYNKLGVDKTKFVGLSIKIVP